MNIAYNEIRVVTDSSPFANIPISSPIEAGIRSAFKLGDLEAAMFGELALADMSDQLYPEEVVIAERSSTAALVINGMLRGLLHHSESTSISGTRTTFSQQTIKLNS